MKDIQVVLDSYGIYQAVITQITHKVYKIDDGQQQFALKKGDLTTQSLSNWEHVFHKANEGQMVTVLPVLLTRNHSLYQKDDLDYFYLTPWINEKKPTTEKFYEAIAHIHSQTKRSQSIDQEKMNQSFNDYKSICAQRKKELLDYVMQFERHRYMSPLELQVCTHYRDIEHTLTKSSEYVDRLIEEQKGQPEWNDSLCHGNLKLSHLLVADQNYIINWEKARYDYPVIDLVDFLKNEVVDYDAQEQSYIDSFQIYMNKNKLHHHEIFLLIIHLLDVTAYMDVVKKYVKQSTTQSMIHQIKQLQVIHRQLLFALKFSRHLETKFISILAEEYLD